MTDGFKKAIGLLMFHNIPFEYGNCKYGEYLIGGHFTENDWTWEIDDAPSDKYGIALQPTYFTRQMDHSISVPEAIKKVMEIETLTGHS